MTHNFVEVCNSRFHFVTSGNPENPVILMLNGIPETWFAFCQQIRDLSDDFYIIALDIKGYGQSEKRLEGDYSFSGSAGETAHLLDKIGIDKFYLMTHDRGSVVGDHLCHKYGMNNRVIKYCRMQQSAHHGHAEPKPSHAFMGSTDGIEAFLDDDFPRAFYKAERGFVEGYRYVFQEIPDQIIDRLHAEWHIPGVAYSVPQTFRTTSFESEWEDRDNFLWESLTMPVLFLQGRLDPGQPPSDYEGLEDLKPNFKLEWIEDAGHFQHLDKPAETTAAIRRFFSN